SRRRSWRTFRFACDAHSLHWNAGCNRGGREAAVNSTLTAAAPACVLPRERGMDSRVDSDVLKGNRQPPGTVSWRAFRRPNGKVGDCERIHAHSPNCHSSRHDPVAETAVAGAESI